MIINFYLSIINSFISDSAGEIRARRNGEKRSYRERI